MNFAQANVTKPTEVLRVFRTCTVQTGVAPPESSFGKRPLKFGHGKKKKGPKKNETLQKGKRRESGKYRRERNERYK
jgi:hypothetical protein